MAKLDAMETEHRQDRQEIKALTAEVTSLQKESHSLRKIFQSIAVLMGGVPVKI